jgi:hypothetical protein
MESEAASSPSRTRAAVRLIPGAIRLALWRAIRRCRDILQNFQVRRDLSVAEATYRADSPSPQTVVDIFKGGWTSAFPPELGVTAGTVDSFDDVRVRWVDETLPGGLRDCTVLELGPYEGYTAWQLERLGVKSVVAIEASDINYLKCLIAKELTGTKARYLHGDAAAYLSNCSERYDIVWASGVLYHSGDPIGLIERMAAVTDTIFIHTHYYDRAHRGASPHALSFWEPWRDRVATIGGRAITLHCKAYGQPKRAGFSGGPRPHAFWLEKDDLFAALRHVGFDGITVGVDDPGNVNGPALFCLARRIR